MNGKRNGKCKEYYNNGFLKFEGEYLNGERNGKGNEYHFNGKLIFEGEYINGQKKGKCKVYYFNDNLKFEGEYLYGKRWNGKEYDYENNMEFEMKDGKGYLKEFYNNNKIS